MVFISRAVSSVLNRRSVVLAVKYIERIENKDYNRLCKDGTQSTLPLNKLHPWWTSNLSLCAGMITRGNKEIFSRIEKGTNLSLAGGSLSKGFTVMQNLTRNSGAQLMNRHGAR